MRNWTFRRAAAAIVLAASLPSIPARAQPIDESRAQADMLFREGQQLLTKGQVAPACAKLEESQRLDPKLGRLLNVAYCHEQLGRTATAWGEYNQAAALALQVGQSERETFARAQASQLARGLSFVQLDVTAAPELSQVAIDGRELARDQWALPLPVDPGSRRLTFAANGHKTQEQVVAVNAPGTIRVHVDPFEALGDAAPVPTPEPVLQREPAPQVASRDERPRPAVREETSGRTIGWILGAVGGAALGVGAGFGIRAISLKNEADNMWCANHECSAHGLSLIGDAKTAATIATVGVAVGVAGVGAGAWLILRSWSGSPQPHLAAYFAADRAGFALRGAW